MDAATEYLEARSEWVSSLKEETAASVKVKAARHRFVLARTALHAEEQELLESKVV